MTSKQRAALRKMAHNMDPVLYIGINGITEATVKEAYDVLEKRELIKCAIQDGAQLETYDACNELCEKVFAEPVQCIGKKFVIYKESRNHKKIDLKAL
ncbi:MAG: YhbY family RNA-binding protein [Eubacteriales bacterium]|nr:YhbY family RNA-binding protein [Eubacteriales bacterium]